MASADLTAERLRELVNYDPVTGAFTRRLPTYRRKAGTAIGHPSIAGYTLIQLDGSLHYAHRLAWLYVTGAWPQTHIDHKNRNRSDNRFDNLREATDRQNGRNRGANRNNKFGHKGVCFSPKKGLFRATINDNRRQKHLGYFNTAVEAAEAYRRAAVAMHGEFACVA